MWLKKAMPALLLGAICFLISSAGHAAAQDLNAGLANAEQEVSQFEREVSEGRQQVVAAGARYRAVARRSAPHIRRVSQKRADLQQLRSELSEQEQEAGVRISQLREQRRQEADDQDEEVRTGVGFGLAALVAGLIALAWGWFRATAPVAALAQIELGQAIGLCVGGGLLLLIVGGALGGSTGAVGALGSFIFCLGLILPTALLLARHSAEVQRGRSKPLLRRERLPAWTSLATAGLMLVFFLAGTGSALFADGANSQPVSRQLEEESEATSGRQGAAELEAAKEEVAEVEQEAAAPLAQRSAARRQLASARRTLGRVQEQLVSAKSSVETLGQRLAALEAKERREAEKEAVQLAREEEEQAEIEEEELASQCHPSYSGCLDPYSPDYDCEGGSGDGPDYTGTVSVTGYDEYELDDDGDGIGCETS